MRCLPPSVVRGVKIPIRRLASLKRRQLTYNTDAISPEALSRGKAAYLGMITQIDHNIGRIWGAIHDTGTHDAFTINDNTLTIFTSDHGELFGDHRDAAKGSSLDGSSRVPFILRLPRTLDTDRHRGKTCDTPINLSDILPHVRTAGAKIPDSVEGKNLLEFLSEAPKERKIILGSAFKKDKPENIAWAAIHDGRYKYTWHFADGKPLLFDLEEDPLEQNNLASATDPLEIQKVTTRGSHSKAPIHQGR